MNRQAEPFIGTREAALILNCHPETLRERVRRRLVPAHYPNGVGRKPMQFLVSELIALQARTKQEATS